MRKAIQAILVFAITYFVLIHVAAWFSPVERFFFRSPIQHGFTFQRVPHFHQWLDSQSVNPKLLITGSSTAYRGINPDYFTSFNAFNISSSSQTPEVSKALIEHALKTDSNIQVVAVDLFPYNWDFPSNESVTDLIVNNPLSAQSPYRDLAFQQKNLQIIHLWLYRSYLHHVLGQRPRFEPKNRHELYRNTGFVATESTLPPIYLDREDSVVIMDAHTVETLLSITNLAKERDCAVFFILPPQLNRPRLNIPYRRLKSRGVFWIDGNEAPIKEGFFIDYHHLTNPGATVYSEWLNHRIQALYTRSLSRVQEKD